MASKEEVSLNEPHKPQDNAIEAFKNVEHDIKEGIRKSMERWSHHEPRMWERAAGISEHDLLNFHVNKENLVLVRSGLTSYGTVIFGKIKLPKIDDAFVHVRIQDPPGEGVQNMIFHSIFLNIGERDADGHAQYYRAIQTDDTPLDWFDI